MNKFFKKIVQYFKPAPPPKIYGTHGRIEIPSLSISLPLYEASTNAQKIVDDKNSAAFIKWLDQDVIVDHSGQDGFERLEKAIPKSTIAYVVYNNGKSTERYICTKKQIGHIKTVGGKNKLLDSQWQHPKSGCLLMYTCIKKSAPDVMDVWLIYWKRI